MKSFEELKNEFNGLTSKNWFDVYNWEALKCKGYEKACAQILNEPFGELKVDLSACRKEKFHQDGHDGLANIKSNQDKFTEKRMCYALYNAYNKEPLGELDKIIDYEVPLKKDQKDPKGKIDLLGYDEKSKKINILELKKPDSNESILKAILEVYVYSRLLQEVRKKFLRDYTLPEDTIFVPNVLTFKQSTSGKQLDNGLSDETKKLLLNLNADLKNEHFEKIRFFYFTNAMEKGKKYLNITPVGNKKRITFNENFIPEIQKIEV